MSKPKKLSMSFGKSAKKIPVKKIQVDVTFETDSPIYAPPDNLNNTTFLSNVTFSDLSAYLHKARNLASWNIRDFYDTSGKSFNDENKLNEATINEGTNEVKITVVIAPSDDTIKSMEAANTDLSAANEKRNDIARDMKKDHADFDTWLTVERPIYESGKTERLTENQQLDVYQELDKYLKRNRRTDTTGLQMFVLKHPTEESEKFIAQLTSQDRQKYLKNRTYRFYEVKPLGQEHPLRFVALYNIAKKPHELERIWVSTRHYSNFKEYTL